jgi:hypothetical protein
MPKNNFDYDQLNAKLNKKTYRLDEVKDRIEKVAFDVVRFRDKDESSNLWQVLDAEDGHQYIIALYQDEEIKKSAWAVKVSSLDNSLNFYYKGDPIATIPSVKLGLKKEDMVKVASELPNRLDTNKKLLSSLLKEVPLTVRKDIVSKYPELQIGK